MHLIGPLGFSITDYNLRRAGLDYWKSVKIHRHDSFDEFMEAAQTNRFFLFSTAGRKSCFSISYQPGDVLIFGNETKGLPDKILNAWPDRVIGIPMQTGNVRSLNLANSVSIVMYEALRQIDANSSAPAGTK